MSPKCWFCPCSSLPLKYPTSQSLFLRSQHSAPACAQPLLISDTQGTESIASEAPQRQLCASCVLLLTLPWLFISLHISLIVPGASGKIKELAQGVPVARYPPANAGDVKRPGFDPWSRRSPGGGHGNPLQCSCLENPMDRGAWQAPWGCKVSEMNEAT